MIKLPWYLAKNLHVICSTDLSNMYPRQQPVLHQQPHLFNQPYNPGPQSVMMGSQASNLQISSSWANPNTALSMDTVTINPSGPMSNMSRPNSRLQQQNRGSGFPQRLQQHSSSGGGENSALPQLSMRDLQCLDSVPQAPVMSQPESQQLFHLQHQRDELASETRTQNHLGNQNQGAPTMWSNFQVQSFNGSVPGGGGGSQGLSSYPFMEGMDGDEFLKVLGAGGSQTSFQLKQESQVAVVQEPLMSSPRESQGNTYTNLLPRPMSNGTNMDPMRQDGSCTSQALKNLHNPYSNTTSMAAEEHFATVDAWIKANRHSE